MGHLHRLLHFVWCWVFGVCFVAMTLGCASSVTLEALRARNPGAQVVEPCVRPPNVHEHARYWAVRTGTGEVVDDRDPDALLTFAESADVLYRYDPDAPDNHLNGLPWPYHHMRCATQTGRAPALPKEFREIPVSFATREALVSILSQECAAEEPQVSTDKQFLGQLVAPIVVTVGDRFTKAHAEEVEKTMKDALRGRAQTLRTYGPLGPGVMKRLQPERDWTKPNGILDTPEAQLAGGAAFGAAESVVPGAPLVVDGAIANGAIPKGTKKAQLGRAIGQVSGSLFTLVVGIDGTLVGGGLTLTGGGAAVGAPICIGGFALATNSVISLCNGFQNLAVVICNGDDEPLASTMVPETVGPGQSSPSPPAEKPVAAKPAPATEPASAPKPAPEPTKPAPQATTPKSAQGPPATTTKSFTKPPPGEVYIRNKHLAGQTHPKTGVPFDADGFPDFKAAGVVKTEVKIKFTGDRNKDKAAANKAANLSKVPSGYTWHHHQDGQTMQLVPRELHADTGHTGGFSGAK